MKSLTKGRLAIFSLLDFVALLILGSVSSQSLAFNNYLFDFNTNYNTQGTRIDNCGLCHFNFNGGGPRTPYGEDFRNNNYSIPAIGSFDSDGDGSINDQEAGLLTNPGLSCSNLISAQNAPVDIANYVDPNNPGCLGTGSPPIVNMNGPYTGVTGNPISFSSAGSFDPDGTIVSYLWNFGNGFGTSIEANPVHTYNLNFGAKILITLTVTDNDGNVASDSTFVSVLQTPNSPPVANAGAPVNGVVNSPVQFDGAASSDPEGGRLTYSWDFGDGSLGRLVNPSHTYNRCGTYNVSLQVTDNVSLTNTASTTATIASSGVDLPVAHAGGGASRLYNGQVGSNVQFDGSGSSDPDCNIVSYSWDFGDGTTGTGMSPLHNYTLAGTYIVTLTVSDNDGLQTMDIATATIINTGPLDGAALYQTNCESCHGVGANSTKTGATVTRINNGIATVPSMNSLSTLTATEVQAISDYLVSLSPPPPPPGPVDGATLYTNNCAGCHGPGSNSTKIGATVTRINNGIATVPSMNSLSTLTAIEVQAISGYLVSLSPPLPPPGPVDGATLYTNNCAGCHGPGDNSAKIGATVTRINNGIATEPSMIGLSSLSAADVQAISDYLVSLSPPPPGPGDGATLYTNNCAGCHGPGDNSAKAGATATRINNGIATEQSMSGLSSLSAADIQAIADFLAIASAPTTPSGLYAANCSSCHGADGSGGSSGEDVRGDSASDIGKAIDKESEMKFLDFLTSQEVQMISDFLNGDTSPPPGGGSGQALYDANCGGCHGTGATSAKAGATVTRINNGIASVPSMNSLSSLPAADIQAISDYLVSLAPTGPVDGATLYTNNCAACHGTGSNSAKAGATATRINNGIATESSMNFLSSLSAADVQAIADFLATAPVPTTPSGLYAAHCSSCHGADGSGGSSDEDVRGDSASDIEKAIDKKSEMEFLSFLNSKEVQLISDFLDRGKD